MLRKAVTGTLLAFALASLVPVDASAQNAPPMRVRGSIEKLEGQNLVVKAKDGKSVPVKLADNVGVLGVTKAKLDDIKPGSYVGAAALPQSDGSLKAIEVLIFPDSARGSGEGHYPWDLLPESTMTNATVADTVSSVNGRVLKLAYKDGEKSILVPAEAPIVTFAPADKSLLKPGAHVFIPATTKQPDGTLTAARVLVGKDGLTPPM